MIDIIIRDCGHGEWLPIIVVTDAKRMWSKRELYRGDRLPSYDAASLAAKTAWYESTTTNIIEFKEERGL